MHCTRTRLVLKFAAALLAGWFVVQPLSAQEPAAPPATGQKVRIAVKPAKPFSFEEKGQLTGYSIDLWTRISKESGITFEVERRATVPQVLDAIQQQEADVGVGALSITEEREKILDFSHPFYSSGLQILTRVQPGSQSLSIFRSLLSMDVLKVVLLLLLALVAMSHVLWFVERKINPDSFPESYREGVQESLWWSTSTIISGGCENIAPKGIAGRLVGVMWMLGGIGLTSYITATLASAMTVRNLTSEIHNIGDLHGQPVATVAGSSAEAFLLTGTGVLVRPFPDIDTAIEELAKSKVKAVVYDSPMLRYYRSAHPDANLTLAGELFERQSYGFALRLGSPLRKTINEALLKLQDEGFMDELDKKWFAAIKE